MITEKGISAQDVTQEGCVDFPHVSAASSSLQHLAALVIGVETPWSLRELVDALGRSFCSHQLVKFCRFLLTFAFFPEISRKLLIFYTDFFKNIDFGAVQKCTILVEFDKCCKIHIHL